MPTQRDIPNPLPSRLEVLVGDWEMQASIGGRLTGAAQASFESLEGGAFLIQRADAGPPLPGAPPEWLANSPFPLPTIIGADDASETFCHGYADARGVCRVYRMTLGDGAWKIWGSPDRSSSSNSPAASMMTAAPLLVTGKHRATAPTGKRYFDVGYSKRE